MKSLICIGEGLYELGLDSSSQLNEGFGGDAANAAVMAASLGVHSIIVGRVGDDELGRRLTGFWLSRHLDLEHLIVDRGRPTGIYVNLRGRNGGHRFDYHRSGSAGSHLAESDVEAVALDNEDIVHFTGIGIAVSCQSARACAALVRRARESGARVSMALNLRPRLAPDFDVVRSASRSASIVFSSEEEAALLFGSEDTALATLTETADEVVITRGASGARLVTSSTDVHVPAPAVKLVDAAGAGDALAGAYLALRLRGDPPRDALGTAVVAASLSCQSFGCALSYPSASDVEAALSQPIGGKSE